MTTVLAIIHGNHQDRVDPAWAKNQARKERLARYAEKVNEEAAQLIQNVVEADSDLDVEMLAHEQSEDDDVEFKPTSNNNLCI